MQYVIHSAAGYYTNANGRPSWVTSPTEAKVFTTVRVARSVVALIRDNRIHATVVRLTSGAK